MDRKRKSLVVTYKYSKFHIVRKQMSIWKRTQPRDNNIGSNVDSLFPVFTVLWSWHSLSTTANRNNGCKRDIKKYRLSLWALMESFIPVQITLASIPPFIAGISVKMKVTGPVGINYRFSVFQDMVATESLIMEMLKDQLIVA